MPCRFFIAFPCFILTHTHGKIKQSGKLSSLLPDKICSFFRIHDEPVRLSLQMTAGHLHFLRELCYNQRRNCERGLPMDQQAYEKRGYLHENYRLFHLTGAMTQPVDWHYHAFHKIILFLSGDASYGIEGRSYALESGDLVLVGRGCIHRPEVPLGAPYERVILYISPEFLRRGSTPDCDLEACFNHANEDFRFVVRPGSIRRELMGLLAALQREGEKQQFGSAILQDALFYQFLIGVSRGMQARQLEYVNSSACDEKIVAILEYLSAHLTQELHIDDLAAHFYISKYHMMRRFKAETGYTIHSYIVTKRLMLAREKIDAGVPVGEACDACGFGDYSAFARAYKKLFGEAPSARK